MGGDQLFEKEEKKCVAFDIFNLIPQHVDKGSIRPAIDPLAVWHMDGCVGPIFTGHHLCHVVSQDVTESLWCGFDAQLARANTRLTIYSDDC